MDNRPTWVQKAHAALARGDAARADFLAAYREAVEIIVDAMAADPALTQAKVAEYFGHKPPWVSMLLKWRRDGYDEHGPFAAEAAARRAMEAVRESMWQPKPRVDYGPEHPWLPGIEGGPTGRPHYDESEATRTVLRAIEMCKELGNILDGLTTERMLMTHAWAPNMAFAKRTNALGRLERALQQASDAAQATLKVMPCYEQKRGRKSA